MSGAAGWKEEDLGDDDNDDGTGVVTRDTIREWLEETIDPLEDDRRRRRSSGSEPGDSVDGPPPYKSAKNAVSGIATPSTSDEGRSVDTKVLSALRLDGGDEGRKGADLPHIRGSPTC
ncbi:hypothetical protein BDW02DRAFT_598981 [Decorospora gaudefroyi]|uniref:Uncharacterized protein n=1 Tax=Decorospora gaudefroyi TaxID=184978 RepID=A0A6A5KEC7_9PLEO|nr:hypothetical protein BDW02DRAFT_598981 [Decorospora gaudefroyi]